MLCWDGKPTRLLNGRSCKTYRNGEGGKCVSLTTLCDSRACCKHFPLQQNTSKCNILQVANFDNLSPKIHDAAAMLVACTRKTYKGELFGDKVTPSASMDQAWTNQMIKNYTNYENNV